VFRATSPRLGRGVNVLFANAGGGEFTRIEDVSEQHFFIDGGAAQV
jgi:hypothetical protein